MDRFERLPDMACEVTPELKQRIRDVNREAHALHTAVFPTVYVGTKVTDFEGNILSPNKEYKANSYTRNYWNVIAYLLTGTKSGTTTFGEGNINRINTDNVKSAFTEGDAVYPIFWSNQANLTGLFQFQVFGGGIVIGTSNSAESFESYKLGASIASGTGAGQMTRLVHIMSNTPSYNATTKTYSSSMSRIFKNTSGGEIAVNESGLCSYAGATMLCERTVFPTPIAVPTGSQIEVTYTFEFVYPEPA